MLRIGFVRRSGDPRVRDRRYRSASIGSAARSRCRLLIAGAVALGLAYGAIKADNPWAGDGLVRNLHLMGV